MSGSAPVLVLGNGASRPKSVKRYRALLSLDYRTDAPGGQNIRLSLPDFIRDVFYLPDRVLDLLELAAYIYSADRLVYRGPRDAVEYQAWARSMEFRVRVRDHAFWSESDVAARLAETLEFLTGDRSYRFSFEPGHRTPATSLFDREECQLEAQPDTSILLFSGGLDSLAGALERLSAGAKQVCLVSHRSGPGIIRTQKSLVRALRNIPGYRNRIRHYPFLCRLKEVKAAEESQRSRAFLYTAIAFALARALGQDEIFLYENGVTSINFGRREDALRARTSRTTHPKTLSLLQALFTTVAESPIQIRDPFIWSTKAEVFERIRVQGLHHLIPSTVSCSRTRLNLGATTHCGTCFQCVDRRLAAYASGCDDIDESGIYAENFITANLVGEAKTTVVDFIRQARDFATWNIDHFYDEKLNELVELVDHLPGVHDEMEGVQRIYELCWRHGEGINRAIRAICGRHDAPYERLPENSFLHIVSGREYLKEPVQRLIESLLDRLMDAIPKMFAKGRLPKDEPDLNQKIKALLDSFRDDLVSEHPTVSFACAKVIPDHMLTATDLLIEAKYIRKGTPPSKASEGIAGDLTKYPQDKHTLFLVYDPNGAIADVRTFERDFESRGRCTVRVIR